MIPDDDWPTHCTPFDRDAPDFFCANDWRRKIRVSECDEVVFFIHKRSKLRFIVCKRPWHTGKWILSTKCDNPEDDKKGRMHELAQQVMRYYVAARGTTVEIEEAVTEALFAEWRGKIH